LDTWLQTTGNGEATVNPDIIFTDEDSVIPDVVWASNERLDLLMDEAEHLTGAPELVVEVLSPGKKMSNEISNSSSTLNRGFKNIGLWIRTYARCRFIDGITLY
jgi:Uma2 family endonuclease